MSEPSEDNKEQSEQIAVDVAAAEPKNVEPEQVGAAVSPVTAEKAPEEAPNVVPVSVAAVAAAPVSAAPVSAKRGNPLVLALIALGGVVVVTAITCDIFEKKLPDFLQPFEPAFEKHIRYGLGYSTGAKDWRNELLVEQAIWSSEVNKIRLADNNAKPQMFKRDFLFYLADSYNRDEPHYSEAKAAYLAGRAEPYIAHKPGYNIEPSELAMKIGNAAMRCASYDEAEKYLKEAVDICDSDKDPERKMVNGGRANYCLDVLTECEIRRNHLTEAQKIINERLRRIKLSDIDGTVESYLLFNNAMLLEKQGKLPEAESFYKKAVTQLEQDDKNRDVVPGSVRDNNRMLAYVLREYARFLRSQARSSESYDLMDRAVSIMNHAP